MTSENILEFNRPKIKWRNLIKKKTSYDMTK